MSADWLREHMRARMASSSMIYPSNDVLNFLSPSHSAKNPGAAILDLVYQAAQLIEDFDKEASERQARAETLAKQAAEKLKIADDRVRCAETARRAAEAELTQFSEQITIKIIEIEQAMDKTASRMAATEAQLAAAEQRATTAEKRASEAENALICIENALRTQIIERRLGMPTKAAGAA